MKNAVSVDEMMGPPGMNVDTVNTSSGQIYDSDYVPTVSKGNNQGQSFVSGSGSGASSLLGAIVNGGFALLGDFLSDRRAEKAADKEYERQIDFWNMQNQYNSPLAQAKRLADAGFNPAAVMSGGVENTSGSAPQVASNAYAKNGAYRQSAAALGSIASTMLDLKLKEAQIRDVEASANLKDSQVGETGERTTSIRIDNAIKTAMDDVEFEIPGFGTFKGARLVSAVSQARNTLIQSYSSAIGYESSKNMFEAREDLDWWKQSTNYDLELKSIRLQIEQANLDLTDKQIDHVAAQIADISSQIGYRTLMSSVSEQQLYELKRHNWTVERETSFHNKATERNQYNAVLVQAYKAQGSLQSALVNALINGSPSIMPE